MYSTYRNDFTYIIIITIKYILAKCYKNFLFSKTNNKLKTSNFEALWSSKFSLIFGIRNVLSIIPIQGTL